MRVQIAVACALGVGAYLAYNAAHHVAGSMASAAKPTAGSSLPVSSGTVASHQQKATAVVKTTDQAVTTDSWYKLYVSAPDRFAFVQQAAKAALGGDGRAAVYVGDAVYDCMYLSHQAKHGVDIVAEHQEQLAKVPQDPSLAVVVGGLEKEHFDRCEKFATGDAFAGLPPREGGYEHPRMWWDMAVKSGDPGALARDANEQLANGKLSDAQAQEAVNKAVMSQDPMALFWTGFTLSNGQYSTNTDHGTALALAACDLGYDCSWNNPAINGASACKFNLNDACHGYTDWPSFTAAKLGADRYATVYAEAQELKTYLASQPDAALAFVKIYRPSGT
jgi:hypothetical protein